MLFSPDISRSQRALPWPHMAVLRSSSPSRPLGRVVRSQAWNPTSGRRAVVAEGGVGSNLTRVLVSRSPGQPLSPAAIPVYGDCCLFDQITGFFGGNPASVTHRCRWWWCRKAEQAIEGGARWATNGSSNHTPRYVSSLRGVWSRCPIRNVDA